MKRAAKSTSGTKIMENKVAHIRNTTFIVIDFEWNQPISWIKTSIDPKALPGEIIEIGAVKVFFNNGKWTLSKPFHRLIRPVCYTVLNKSVARVINKVSSDLKCGDRFDKAYMDFMSWCGTDFVICGWGNSDLGILKANLRLHGQSTAQILRQLLLLPTAKTIEEGFSENENEDTLMIVDKFIYDPDLNMKISFNTELFCTWEKCFAQSQKQEIECPACGAPLLKELPWFRIKKSAFSIWRCEKHQWIRGRMRMKKNSVGKTYATVDIQLIIPSEIRKIQEKHKEYLDYGPEGKPVESIENTESQDINK